MPTDVLLPTGPCGYVELLHQLSSTANGQSTSSRSRLMAEVVVPVLKYATRSETTGSQAAPDVATSQTSEARRAAKPITKISRAAKSIARSRAKAQPEERSTSNPVTGSVGDSEREIDGLIDDEQAPL